MTNLLIKLFIRDSKNTTYTVVRKHYGYLGAFTGIVLNILLFLGKLTAGILSGSISVIADALNNLSDAGSSIMTFVGFRMAGMPADSEHPYGHDRLECVASMVLAAILLATGIGIGMSGVKTIIAGDYSHLQAPGTIALVAAIVSILTKEGMFWYTRHYAKILDSAAFMADAWHHRSDAFSSVGSLIGIGGAMLGFPVLDPLASVVICIFILKVAFDIFKDALDKMLEQPQLHGIQVGIATYLMSLVQDHRYKRVNTIFTDTGFWDYVATLDLKRKDYERAIDLAPSIKPFRHTYLHEEKYREKAKEILCDDAVLKKVLK